MSAGSSVKRADPRSGLCGRKLTPFLKEQGREDFHAHPAPCPVPKPLLGPGSGRPSRLLTGGHRVVPIGTDALPRGSPGREASPSPPARKAWQRCPGWTETWSHLTNKEKSAANLLTNSFLSLFPERSMWPVHVSRTTNGWLPRPLSGHVVNCCTFFSWAQGQDQVQELRFVSTGSHLCDGPGHAAE